MSQSIEQGEIQQIVDKIDVQSSVEILEEMKRLGFPPVMVSEQDKEGKPIIKIGSNVGSDAAETVGKSATELNLPVIRYRTNSKGSNTKSLVFPTKQSVRVLKSSVELRPKRVKDSPEFSLYDINFGDEVIYTLPDGTEISYTLLPIVDNSGDLSGMMLASLSQDAKTLAQEPDYFWTKLTAISRKILATNTNLPSTNSSVATTENPSAVGENAPLSNEKLWERWSNESLAVFTKEKGPTIIELTKDPVEIGRGATSTAMLKSDKVSSIHASVRVSDYSSVAVEDLESTNGTTYYMLNHAGTERLVNGEMHLRNGDIIRFGDTAYVVFEGTKKGEKVFRLVAIPTEAADPDMLDAELRALSKQIGELDADGRLEFTFAAYSRAKNAMTPPQNPKVTTTSIA